MVLIVLSGTVVADETKKQTPAQCVTIVDLLLSEFQKKNEKINTVDIQDIKQVWNVGYVIAARGYRKEQDSFSGNWDDELFGFFQVDPRLNGILRKIDVVSTIRWHDYWYKVKEATWGELIVEGTDGYGSSKIRKYDLTKIQ
jgi:hypothetical protein